MKPSSKIFNLLSLSLSIKTKQERHKTSSINLLPCLRERKLVFAKTEQATNDFYLSSNRRPGKEYRGTAKKPSPGFFFLPTGRFVANEACLISPLRHARKRDKDRERRRKRGERITRQAQFPRARAIIAKLVIIRANIYAEPRPFYGPLMRPGWSRRPAKFPRHHGLVMAVTIPNCEFPANAPIPRFVQ